MKSSIKYGFITWLLLLLGSTMLLASLPADDDFNPSSPPEPNVRFKVEVVSSPYAYSSGSGKYLQGENVYISTSSSNENYQFSYWKKDGERYTDQQYFSYTMTDENVVFEAVYDYVPVNPAEPSPMNKYRLYLDSDDSSNCSFNRASGEKVEAGMSVWLNASLSMGYKFLGWYTGEELISKEQSFYYTMPTEDVRITAHVAYSPESPADPSGPGQDNVDTGISQVALPSKISQAYHLDGTKAAALQPGQVYIINHKKVLVR